MNEELKVLTTKIVKTDDEAISMKMKALNPKLLGLFVPVPYTLLDKKRILVPYCMMKFRYTVARGKNNGKKPGMLDREGVVGIIYDLNEAHGFYYDVDDDLGFVISEKALEDGIILPERHSEAEIVEMAKDTVKNKYLNRALKWVSELELLERRKFYRPAWELTVEANEKVLYRYAYLDGFGTVSENALGLRVRLNV